MAKQPARLADFQIPRGEGTPPELVGGGPPASVAPEPDSVPLPAAASVPLPIAPRPVAEPRQALTTRLPVSMHERLRVLMFASRRSQQDIVEAALDLYLRAEGT